MWQKNDGASEANIIQNQFTAYLVTAVKRRKAAYIKELAVRQQAMRYLDLSELEVMGNSATNLDEELSLLEQLENPLLLQALLQAKDRERYILLARILDERSFVELSEELGITYKAASNAYYRLVERIRRMMEGGEENE